MLILTTVRFQNGCNKVVIELRVVQFWSEIILVISDQIALHSVQLPLLIKDFPRKGLIYNTIQYSGWRD